jgi:phosphopantothenoylcysteine decarboxylase/phosphopantothenate--cysteine ligase
MPAKLPRFVVTAGPTREHLDPVRFLSNPSTGKMGFAVAEAAARKGCETVLVAGPVALKTPAGVRRVDVVSAREMLAAVKAAVDGEGETVLVATAAVADWRPAKCAARKLKKRQMSGVLKLVRNPDILKTVKGVRKVGFAAETGAPVKEAARKCREKQLEFTVANDVLEKGAGFGCDTNKVVFVYPDGSVKDLPLMSKRLVARRIVDEVLRA